MTKTHDYDYKAIGICLVIGAALGAGIYHFTNQYKENEAKKKQQAKLT